MIHPVWLYVVAVGVLLVAAALAIGATILQLRHRAEGFRRYGDRLVVQWETLQARVAGELHDDACQRIAFLCLELDQLAQGAPDPECARRVGGLRAELADLGDTLRLLAHNLHPTHLTAHTLPDLLDELVEAARREGGVTVEVSVRPVAARLTREQALCAYRVAQEALHNALKHAQASRITIALTADPAVACLAVEDDGVGFTPAELRHTTLGLTTMRERAQLADGTLHLTSAPGTGTRIEVRFPLRDHAWPAS